MSNYIDFEEFERIYHFITTYNPGHKHGWVYQAREGNSEKVYESWHNMPGIELKFFEGRHRATRGVIGRPRITGSAQFAWVLYCVLRKQGEIAKLVKRKNAEESMPDVYMHPKGGSGPPLDWEARVGAVSNTDKFTDLKRKR